MPPNMARPKFRIESISSLLFNSRGKIWLEIIKYYKSIGSKVYNKNKSILNVLNAQFIKFKDLGEMDLHDSKCKGPSHPSSIQFV